MSPQDMKEILIERTLSIIAMEGIDKATTKAITSGTGINEAYIYRYFANKDELLKKAFEKIDYDFVLKLKQHISVMYMDELDLEIRYRLFFSTIWNFFMENKTHCLAYRQYYYSPYFWKHSAEEHKKRYLPIVEEIKSIYKEEADVWMIMNYVLNVMLGFAVMAHNDQMPKNDDYVEHVFRVVYTSIRQYFKDDKGEKNEESI